MAKHNGLIPSDEADKLYSYPTLPAVDTTDTSLYLAGNGTWDVPYTHPTHELTKHPTIGAVSGNGNMTAPEWTGYNGHSYYTEYRMTGFDDGAFWGYNIQYDNCGHRIGSMAVRTYLPTVEASSNTHGLMSAADKTKLDGIATGANAYTHPSYTARTGKPTANATPAFGATFTVSQITSDATGHVTNATDRTVKIPALPTVSGSAYGVMTAAMYTSLTGAMTRLASLESILTTTCTSSIDASGCAVFKLSNGTTIIKVDKAGEW